MKKSCQICGSNMEVTIRTLKFKRKLEFKNVPVYSCPECQQDELVDQVKPKVISLLDKHEGSIKRKTIKFEEESELAQLVLMAYHDQETGRADRIIHNEVEELLEEFTLENGTSEEEWKDVIHRKIEKLVH